MESKRPVKQITLRKKRYLYERVPKIDNQGSRGDCSPPSEPDRRIRLQKKLRGVEELEVNVHEMLHGCFWDVAEEVIEEVGDDISRALWRLGYRKVDGPPANEVSQSKEPANAKTRRPKAKKPRKK